MNLQMRSADSGLPDRSREEVSKRSSVRSLRADPVTQGRSRTPDLPMPKWVLRLCLPAECAFEAERDWHLNRSAGARCPPRLPDIPGFISRPPGTGRQSAIPVGSRVLPVRRVTKPADQPPDSGTEGRVGKGRTAAADGPASADLARVPCPESARLTLQLTQNRG